jgi:hypothetical protein
MRPVAPATTSKRRTENFGCYCIKAAKPTQQTRTMLSGDAVDAHPAAARTPCAPEIERPGVKMLRSESTVHDKETNAHLKRSEGVQIYLSEEGR